jgi:hypothetical protein
MEGKLLSANLINRSKAKTYIDTMNRKYCVAKPANTKETSSKRCQSLALPDHPKITKNIFSFEKASQLYSNHCKKSI